MKTLSGCLSVLVLLTIFISCSKSPSEPEPVIKTPDQMTWTRDILVSPDSTSIQLMMHSITAFSARDVWICGWSDVARGLIWHFDGNKWTESNIYKDVGGMRVDDLAGNSGTDLWAGGYTGSNTFLAHYNGYKWERYPDMGIKGEIIKMTKDPNGNLWACARNGVVFKYMNGKWTADTIKINNDNGSFWFAGIQYYKNKIFIIGTIADPHQEKFYFITGDMKNWAIRDSFLLDSPDDKILWGGSGLFTIGKEKIFSAGQMGIWEYENGQWNLSRSVNGTVYSGYGISNDYIIAVGDKSALFYNGSNWVDFYNLLGLQYVTNDTVVFRDVWTNGYETFIVGYGVFNGYLGTIVCHGK